MNGFSGYRAKFIMLAAMFACLLFAGNATWAEPAPIDERTYDLRDLLVDHPDFTNAPTLGIPASQPAANEETGNFDNFDNLTISSATQPVLPAASSAAGVKNGGAIFGGGPAPSTQQAADRHERRLVTLMGWIKSSLTADDPAGPDIVVSDDHFRIRTTPAAHLHLMRLLEALRARRNIQITIETRSLYFVDPTHAVSDAAVGQLLADKIRLALGPDSPAVRLTTKEVNRLLEKVQASGGMEMNAPRVTLYNNQRAYVLVTTERAYVSGYHSSATEVLIPNVETVESGMLLDVRVTSNPDDDNIGLMLHVEQARLMAMLEKPAGTPVVSHAPATQPLMIEVPIVSKRTIRRVLSVPSGDYLLLAVAPMQAKPATGPATSSDESPVQRLLMNDGSGPIPQFILVRPQTLDWTRSAPAAAPATQPASRPAARQ